MPENVAWSEHQVRCNSKKKMMRQADFMSRTDVIETTPETWKDQFFSDAHYLYGS